MVQKISEILTVELTNKESTHIQQAHNQNNYKKHKFAKKKKKNGNSFCSKNLGKAKRKLFYHSKAKKAQLPTILNKKKKKIEF